MEQQNSLQSTVPRVDPKLLSFLEKLVNPLDHITLQLQVNGIYCFPEEWKVADEANPTLFTYSTRFSGIDISEGKLYPRQLTEKELKEIEEAQAAKAKKNIKKDPKNEPPPPTAEELEKQRKIQEELEAEEQKRLAEWNALDEQTRFYRTYEDKYKHPSIKFENFEGQIEKLDEELVILEERVCEDKGDWLFFIKQTTLTEEETVKMRKTKPKNLKLEDLNPVVMRTWIDYTPLTVPGTIETIQRCKLEQYFGELKEGEVPPADVPKPNLENTYIMVKITVNPAINPLIKEIQPKASDLIPKPQPIVKDPPAIECINEFKADLSIIMESLGMEYENMFGKEKNVTKNTLTVQKKDDIAKKKGQFLYEFNVSGKYKILKERLKKSIVRICKDKFQKVGSITGITTDQKDQFYSELYVFLVEEMRKTLSEIIKNKREELHEDIVIGYEQTTRERDKIIATISKETPQETLLKLATEYEILNNLEMAEKNLQNLLESNKKESKYWFAYAKFCLRRKNYPKAEESLTEALTYDSQNLEYKLLMVCLYIKRNRFKEALVFLKSLLEAEPLNTLYNSLVSFIYGSYLNESKLAKKYHAITQRIFMRSQGLLPPKATHKVFPNPFELPDYKAKSIAAGSEVKKNPPLTNDQEDDIYTEMIDFFVKNQMFDLVEKAITLIFDKITHKALIFQSQIESHKEHFQEAVALLNKILEYNSKNFDVLIMKANLCFLSDKFYESEETFFKALKIKGQKNNFLNFSIYLRLGNIYLKRKSWGDAKAIFAKACELINNSPLAWLGLGISGLRYGEYKEAEEALTQSNIYDPFNYLTWGYLSLLCLKDGNRFIQANQSLREMFKTDILTADILLEIGDELLNLQKFDTAEVCYKKIIKLYEIKPITAENEIGSAYIKLGKIYNNQAKPEIAKNMFESAIDFLEGENEKENIRILIENLGLEN